MKKFLMVLCISVAVVAIVTPAMALELWDLELRGATEGGAAGALPPPGFYFINTQFMLPNLTEYDNGGTKLGGKLFIFIENPALLWVTGCKFLCADYGMALSQGILFTSLEGAGQNWGTFNTHFTPYILSWKLPCDFHVKTALTIGFNDGSSNNSNTPYAIPTSNNFYTFAPEVGISWLHNGWNLSVDFFFVFPTKDTYTNYQSGDQIEVDYTITKTCGKWTFGLGAAQFVQVTNDSQNGSLVADPGATGFGNKEVMYALGPIVAYNFGPCSLKFFYDFAVYSANGFGGDFCELQLVVPLGNPFK